MIPRFVITGLVAASESAIAAGMRAAQLTPDDLAPMAGKTLRLNIVDLDMEVWIICGDEVWWLATESQGEADVALSGTLGNLVDTARSMTKPNSPLIFDGLDIRGSVGVLQTMQSMVKKMNLDWEDIITRSLGPIPAQIIIQTLVVARKQWLISRDSLKRQTTDFLSADQKLVLTQTQLEEYRLRISRLTKRIDRLEAKLQRAKKDE